MKYTLPVKRNFLKIVFILFIIFFFGSIIIKISSANARLYFSLFFSFLIIYLIYLLFYNLFGNEVVYFEGSILIIQKDLFKLKIYNKYNICTISEFIFSLDDETYNEISFDYDNSIITFGVGHDKNELYEIGLELNKSLINLKNQNCV